MARPKKTGLDYFPVDVSFDEKIESIEMLHGNNGLVWVLKFWQTAYKTETGEVNFNGLFGELHTNNCRINKEEHEKILKNAISVGFCFETEPGFYTSNGIKKRIGSVSKERSDAIIRQEERKNQRKNKRKKSKVKKTPHYSANNLSVLNTPQYRIAFLLWKSIKNSGTIMSTPDLLQWSKEIEKIHQLDNKPWDLINNIMQSAREDPFWKDVLRSAKKLRDHIKDGKFDKFIPETYRNDEKYLFDLAEVLILEKAENETKELIND